MARNLDHKPVFLTMALLPMVMEKVFLFKAEGYDPRWIEAGIKQAAQALLVSLPAQGDVFLHVDCPWADSRFAPHAHTHPAMIEGVAKALSGASLSLGGCSLPYFPTRYSFKQAGYDALARKLDAELVAFEEVATRQVELGGTAVVNKQVGLPSAWDQAAFRISLPKLRCSTLVSFAGALRHMQSLLSQAAQVTDSHRLPEKMVDLLPTVSPNLIVVDAIHALHKGGELSGEPVELGLIIIGTHPLAVDVVCAVLLGLEPPRVDFLGEAASRGLGPSSLDEIELLGDLTLDEVRSLSQKVQMVDPDPVHYVLPKQVKILRSEKARQAGSSGNLIDVLSLIERSGVSLKSATEATIVIGAVAQIPPPTSDTATLIFIDDTSRGEYTGYSRIVRLPGRNIPISQMLNDVPYALKVINLRAELGAGYLTAKLGSNLTRIVRRMLGGKV